jgi:DNA-binding XRE family transcriptional regulator
MDVKKNSVRDLREYRELRANALGATATPLRKMHRQELVRCQLYFFAPKCAKKRRPVLMRNPLALAPLLDRGAVDADVGRHFGKRVPAAKDVVERSHVTEYAPDELSGQAPPIIPMTENRAHRTIRPMGRGVTPVKFRSEMAKRLRAARVMARYETQKQAADALGVGLDRYEKWENGRTPVPAQYIGPVCALFHVDANYLFGIETAAVAARKTG